MIRKYYFDNTNLDKVHATLWNGYLICETNATNILKSKEWELDDIFVEICHINFYINIIDNIIYISLCQDEKYYFYQFEKNIKNMIESIQIKYSIKIESGEFNAIEIKNFGNQYKYIIKNKDNKISLKKKILNWDSYETKKVKIKKIQLIDDLGEKLDNLTVGK
jgi:hypothetical protein